MLPLNEPSPRGELVREYAGSFYPDTLSAREAANLKLTWGQKLSGLDLQVPASPRTLLTGVF